MGRNRGSFLRATCCKCGSVERATGTNSTWRCSGCKTERANDQSHMTVAKAKREGLLPSARGLTCVDCNEPAVDYDHRDYNRPLRVDPVCRRCNLKRGPAIPRLGDLSGAVARGYRPYFSRRSVSRILGLLGLPPTILDGVPSALQMEHWQQLAPVIEAGVAAHCARLDGGESHGISLCPIEPLNATQRS